MTDVIWPDRSADLWQVFRLPEALPKGFCFGGGMAVGFLMVDWFNAPPDEMAREEVIGWLQKKTYAENARTYLVVTNTGEAFTFRGAEDSQHE